MRTFAGPILLTILLFCNQTGLSQPAVRKNAINAGNIYGKLIDSASSRAVSGATIQVFQNKADSLPRKRKEVILSTQVTDKKGEFNIDNLPVTSRLFIRISAIGYRMYEKQVNLDKRNDGHIEAIPAAIIKDLGNIKLSVELSELQNITVSSSRNLLQMSLDKKIYNVERDLSVTGGTAVDVMKNVPSVNVDIDGNVTMRNASPQIFVDGRPTTLTLDQIPADQIAVVEIMTNPSAKFDAGGGGSGILNIILKKNRRAGYNGNVRTSIDSRAKPGFGGDFNIKRNKVNFFAAGNLGYRRIITIVNSRRIDSLPYGLSTITQKNRPLNNSSFSFGRIGMDYLLDNRNTFSVSGNAADGTFKVTDEFDIYRDSIRPMNNFKEYSWRSLNVKAGFRNYGTTLGYKHNFARADRELTADANFNYNENYNTSDYHSALFDSFHVAKPIQGAQKATGGGHSRILTVQTDYTDPFTETQKIEFGLRGIFRSYNNWNDNYLENISSNVFELQPGIGVRYNYRDYVLAGYISYSQQISKFTYQLGMRVENSQYKGIYETRNQNFSTKYPLSLFPTAFFTYKINGHEDLQLNYSRKVNRPGFSQLVPFVDFSDSLNLSVGNPSLKPEFSNLAELAYNNQFNNSHSVLLSLYGKLTEDLITRYQYIDAVINPSKPARYTTYINANRSFTAGLEVTTKDRFISWWDLTSNLNLFHVNINDPQLTGGSENQRFSWFAKMNNSFKLSSSFSVQLSGEYQAKTIVPASSASRNGGSALTLGVPQSTAQGYLKPTYGMDIAIKKDFLKNHTASVTLQFTDVFRTRIYATHAESAGFMQDNSRRRDPQVMRLNFSWRFGKFDIALQKRKNTKNDLDNLQSIQGGQ